MRNVIFEKIQKYTPCFETYRIFKVKSELKCAMSFLRKLRNRLLALKHVLFAEKIEN